MTSRSLVAAAALLAGAAAVSPAAARQPSAEQGPAIRGTVYDSATGRPAPRVLIARVAPRQGHAAVATSDTLGAYRLGGLQPGKNVIAFRCPTRGFPAGRQFAERVVHVAAGADRVVDFRLGLSGCVEPPVDTIRGEFRGQYTAGFESSVFVPCTPFSDLTGTAYEGRDVEAWVTFSEAARQQVQATRWPDVEPRSYGTSYEYRTYHVRWRGTLTGPGSYGHLGGALYGLEVGEVLEVRAEPPADCRVASPYEDLLR